MHYDHVLSLPSRFDYAYYKKFTEAYMALLHSVDVNNAILDFSNVEHLDSAALGMMVLMQKKFKEQNKSVKLKGARGSTNDILRMANMNKIFEFI